MEENNRETFFDEQFDNFKSNSMVTGSIDLKESLVEEHNFFNGTSPANNAYAINNGTITESFEAEMQ